MGKQRALGLPKPSPQFRRRLRWALTFTASETRKAILTWKSIFAAIPAVLLVIVLWFRSGLAEANDYWTGLTSSLLAAGLALPLIALINLVRSISHARSREHALGTWNDRTFLFHRPQLVLTARVTTADNNKPIEVKIGPDVIAPSLVRYVIEAEQATDRVQAVMGWAHGGLINLQWAPGHAVYPMNAAGRRTGGIRFLGAPLSLCVCLKPDTIPVNVRVYVSAFELDAA